MDYLSSFIIWSLAVFGISNIIVFSALLKKPRDWVSGKIPFLGKLLNCIMCLGFWAGAFLGETYWSPSKLLILREYPFAFSVQDFIMNGCIGSAISWILYLHLAEMMRGK